jgi:hypothetical protein
MAYSFAHRQLFSSQLSSMVLFHPFQPVLQPHFIRLALFSSFSFMDLLLPALS